MVSNMKIDDIDDTIDVHKLLTEYHDAIAAAVLLIQNMNMNIKDKNSSEFEMRLLQVHDLLNFTITWHK